MDSIETLRPCRCITEPTEPPPLRHHCHRQKSHLIFSLSLVHTFCCFFLMAAFFPLFFFFLLSKSNKFRARGLSDMEMHIYFCLLTHNFCLTLNLIISLNAGHFLFALLLCHFLKVFRGHEEEREGQDVLSFLSTFKLILAVTLILLTPKYHVYPLILT